MSDMELLERERKENKALSLVLCSRNDLINQFLELTFLSRHEFNLMFEMRTQNWAKDKQLLDEIKTEVMV